MRITDVKMKFTSLQDVYKNYIQSFPEFTHLDLTANEIKLIELILSYTRNGGQFYMNYTNIADYLFVGKGKNKAKVVEKVVRKLYKAGYITKETTHNFNGKNGGSSANIRVNEAFLEEQLHKAFNPEHVNIETVQETLPVVAESIVISDPDPVKSIHTDLQNIVPQKTFIDELNEMDALEDDVKYIDASLAKIGDADGVMVKIIGEANVSIFNETEPTAPELLPIEEIKSKLRTMTTDERYQSQQSSIKALLTVFDHKTVEEFNGFYNHILDSVKSSN